MDAVYDVIIIGGGPAGLSAAQYAARSALKTVVLDKSSTAGALAYTSRIENYPGVKEPLSGKVLLDQFREQAVSFGVEYIETQVVGVQLTGQTKEVFTMDASYTGHTVIIATGAMGRKPSIEGEAELLGRGVSYCAICDAAFYRGRTVCVLGNSQEAVKEAGVLAKFADKVYLITPAGRVDAGEHQDILNDPKVEQLLNRHFVGIKGTDAVEGIQLKDKETQKEDLLKLDGVFVYIHGSKPITDFLMDSIELAPDGGIKTNETMETSVPGVFAAGDCIDTEVRQVVLAAANGCTAALSAEKYIHKRKKLKSDWAKGGGG